MKNIKEYMHIRITNEVYSMIASIAKATRRTIGATGDLLAKLGIETFIKSENSDILIETLKEGGDHE